MKQLQLLLPLAFLLVVQNLSAQNKAIIKGKIQKPLSEEVILASYPSPLIPEEVQTVVKLNEGKFELEVPVTQAGIVELVHGEEVMPVYLEPGYELNLTFNGDKFLKSIKFEGKGANENNLLSQYTSRFDEEEDYQVLPDNIKLREKEFVVFLDARKEDQLDFLEKLTDKKPVSEKFKAYLLAEIAFSYANDKLTYAGLRERVVINDAVIKPGAGFYSFLDELDMQNPVNLLSPSFITFLRNYTTFMAQSAGYKEADKTYYKASYELARQKLQGEVRTLALAQILKQAVQKGHVQYTEALLLDFSANYNKPEVDAYLGKLHAINKKFGIGSPAPDFMLTNIDGQKVSLSDFKGNLVYLSFWRTNCGLCMVDLPHKQELSKKFAGRNVVFLNVAIDDNEQAWRQMVRTRQLQGVHLYQSSVDADLVKQYELKDVPAYFLIDEEGAFISVKPRRPTDREIEKDITRHLTTGSASVR
ncbi:TlpA disulfide reductase family protein [Pontibacter ruber]|uniref:Redoxin domain-containing protein n=1 Tax=Pontibacter ruber TaxID=1343895 RepID=A0ABW5CZS1_9BACT|nr:TlpA disulfide reductase family protein [Pontibacter ruber]